MDLKICAAGSFAAASIAAVSIAALSTVSRFLALSLTQPLILSLAIWHRGSRLLIGDRCRFYPSCSVYAATALRRFGMVRGGWLTLCRVGRCHPWCEGGIDLVPERLAGWCCRAENGGIVREG